MSKNTIIVKNHSDVFEEYIAYEAVYPGHLLALDADLKVKKHATAGGPGTPMMFAVEDALQGKTIDDAYAADDPVQVWIPGRGDDVYAILADGETVVKGGLLESNADGTLKAASSGTAIAVALEALDLSGSDSSAAPSYDQSGVLGYDKRILVKIL